MFNSLSSFLFSKTPSPDNMTTSTSASYDVQELDGDWLLVDPIESLRDGRRRRSDSPDFQSLIISNVEEEEIEENGELGTYCKTLLSLHLPLTCLENQITPPSSPSQQMDGSWYVTPPPCFTAGSPAYLETSPLENLLIEHPSMSVYGPISNFSFLNMRRSQSPCFERSSYDKSCLHSETECDENIDISLIEIEASPRIVLRHDAHHRGSSRRRRQFTGRALSATLDAVAVEERLRLVQSQKVQYRFDQCKLKASNIDRQNRSKQYKSTKGQSQRRSQWLMQPIKSNRKC